MICSKQDLKEYIDKDNNYLVPDNLKELFIANYACYPAQKIKKYLYYLRKQEFYINTAKGNKVKGILGIFFERKKNKLGIQLGIDIGPNCFEKGLYIYHAGNIIINSSVKVGENCKLHGNNCIGNNGYNEKTPVLGKNVDVGFGAIIIGDIIIADNVIIGANTLVNKSVLVPGSVVVGVPGKVINN